MKKKDLSKKMAHGLIWGAALSSTVLSAADSEKTKSDFIKLVEETNGNIASAGDMTEDSLLLQINQKTAELYQSLTPEGKELAIELAGRGCNGQNTCKGRNACRTDKNSCMGKGECKGQTICAFSDKADAVKVAAELMKKKREGLLENQSGKANQQQTPAAKEAASK